MIGVFLTVLLMGLFIYGVVDRQAGQDTPVVEGPTSVAACQPVSQEPDLGGGHIATDPDTLAASSPGTIYPGHPPTSGQHIGQVVASGVYDVVVDPRITTHNLEHGYVVIWYDDGVAEEDLAALRAWADTALGAFPKLVVAEYYESLPGDADVALTAWFTLQTCGGFDTESANAFLRHHYDTVGQAPEKGLAPHLSEGNGVLVPEGDDLLLPPLDQVS